MSIVKEKFREGESWFVRTYSDTGRKIRKKGTDEVYGEAVDPVFTDRFYEETDEFIERDPEENKILVSY